MADLVPSPASAAPEPSALSLLTDPAGGSMGQRLSAFAASEGLRRLLPAFVGVAALGGAALAWSMLSPAPQRLLYSQLDDSARAAIVPALDQAGIDYAIDSSTGALTVAEDDFYKARMLVASDGGLAAPESGVEMLDSLPMGASRMMEGERLRAARERDLMLTIKEIEGVESVRVNIAEGERSAFVRDTIAPSASVMLRLARGKQLSSAQVAAVVNLVAASVPGLAPEAVRVADQQGRLLSDRSSQQSDRLDLQSRIEQKLREQLSRLLVPMLGDGNFSSEIQVELDMDEVTRAREAYDKEGVVRSETDEKSTASAAGTASGVPGATSNTPPPAAQAADRPPQGTEGQTAPNGTVNGQSRTARTYELGREVSVANTTPGGIKRLSVAVAVSNAAMKGAKPADIAQIEKLVSSAVGADSERGDAVTVVVRKFEPVAEEEIPFYETGWFAGLIRQGSALLAVLLVLLFAVRPVMRMLRGGQEADESDDFDALDDETGDATGPDGLARTVGGVVDRERLDAKVGLARRMVSEQPDSAVAALRLMLSEDAARLAAPDTEATA
ncbi:MAG: flagellar M-ring protein FliF [Novosphingobium sp.]|nr:flagellar M-ring protein FliF [Novosphingobium sp.]